MNIYKQLFNLLKENKLDELYTYIDNIDDDFDLDIRDENDIYLLHYIILLNNNRLCELLLQKKCRLDIIDKEGKSILYIPILYNYYNIVKLLVNYNKKIVGVSILDISDINGNTAIHYSIMNKNYIITELLIENDANVNQVDANKYDSLHHAVMSRSEEICKLIIKNIITLYIFTKNGESSLHIAVNLQLYDICKILLENKFNPNIQNINNELTPLHLSISNINTDIYKLLLDFNANINIQDNKGNTILHYILLEHKYEFLSFIINNDSLNFNLWNIMSMIPLHIILNDIDIYNTLYKNSPEYIDKILSNSNLSIQDYNGDSCLLLLIKNNIWKNHIDILKHKKLNIFIVNNDNKRVIDYINKQDYNLVIDMIVQGYINILKKSDHLWKNELNTICSYEFTKIPNNFINKLDKYHINNEQKFNEYCYAQIKKNILVNIKTKQTSKCKYSYPNNKLCFQIDYGLSINFCTFIGTPIDIIMGLIYILKKHPYASSIFSHNVEKNKDLCKFYKSHGVIINSKCEFLNFEILWIDYKLFIIDNLNSLIKKAINNKLFVIIPLGIELINNSHANYIIYDIKNNTVERFEPHGSTFPIGFNYNPQLLDKTLKYHFQSINPNIKYIKPEDYMPKIGFQTLENIDNTNKKFNDPGGFCALWSLWYVDMRLTYKEVDIKILVNELIKQIKYNKLSFKNLIRNYSKQIVELRDEILLKSNLNINDWLNDNITNIQVENIMSEILNIINKLNI